jgi:hypothetical protein
MSVDPAKALTPQSSERDTHRELERFKRRLRRGTEILYRKVDFDYETQVNRYARYYDTTPFHQSPSLRWEV